MEAIPWRAERGTTEDPFPGDGKTTISHKAAWPLISRGPKSLHKSVDGGRVLPRDREARELVVMGIWGVQGGANLVEGGDPDTELTPRLPSGFSQLLPFPLPSWGALVEEETGVVE